MSQSLPMIPATNNHPQTLVSSLTNERSVFDISKPFNTGMNFDNIYPFYWEEVVPSDTFKIQCKIGAYLATPIHPLMDNIWVQWDFWFVPWRLTWDNSVYFFGEKRDGVTEEHLIPIIDNDTPAWEGVDPGDNGPTFNAGGIPFNSMFDYFGGLNCGVAYVDANDNYVTALLYRSYNLTVKTWYCDQDYGSVRAEPYGATGPILQENFPIIHKGNGPDPAYDYQLYKKGKKKDYFTSIRPYLTPGADTQFGLNVAANPTFATIISNSVPPTFTGGGNTDMQWRTRVGSTETDMSSAAGSVENLIFGDETGLTVNMGQVSISMNAIRMTEYFSQYFELLSRSGSRYVEQMYAFYGVEIEDSRLQLPEWICGHTERVNVTPVAQTSETDTTPLGELAAFATLVASQAPCTKSFPEHGYVIGLMTLYPDLSYYQGIDKKLQRRTVHEVYNPKMQHLPEQAVYVREMNQTGLAADKDILGFQKRWSEMKYGRRQLTSYMRPNHPETLASWHAAQELPPFAGFTADLRTYETDAGRFLATENGPSLIVYGEVNVTAARPMMIDPTPMIGGW